MVCHLLLLSSNPFIPIPSFPMPSQKSAGEEAIASKSCTIPNLHRIYKNLREFTPVFEEFTKIYVIYSVNCSAPPPPPFVTGLNCNHSVLGPGVAATPLCGLLLDLCRLLNPAAVRYIHSTTATDCGKGADDYIQMQHNTNKMIILIPIC